MITVNCLIITIYQSINYNYRIASTKLSFNEKIPILQAVRFYALRSFMLENDLQLLQR